MPPERSHEPALLGLVLDSVAEGVLVVDTHGRITLANPAACRLLGYTNAELVGASEHDLIHHSRADGSPYPIERSPVHATLRDGSVHHASGDVFWRKDGASLPVDFTSTPIREGARLVGAAVVFTDARERSKVEDVSRKARERMMRLYEALSDPFVAVDREWRVVGLNGAAERSRPVGDRGSALGKRFWEAWPKLGAPFEAEHRAGRSHVGASFEAESLNGRYFDVVAYPSDDGFFVHMRDVTERQRAVSDAKASSIARPLARRIVQDLVETGGVSHQILTQVGRNLAAGTAAGDLDSFLRGFTEMGLGSIALERGENQRYAFAGSDLLEKRPGSRVATCSFTLGYLSEAVSRIHGNEHTLGTEIECQSRGAKDCKFVVQVKKPEEGLARRVKELV